MMRVLLRELMTFSWPSFQPRRSLKVESRE